MGVNIETREDNHLEKAWCELGEASAHQGIMSLDVEWLRIFVDGGRPVGAGNLGSRDQECTQESGKSERRRYEPGSRRQQKGVAGRYDGV